MKVRISKRDARVILGIMNKVGGTPSGPRGAADRLRIQLEAREIQSAFGVYGEVGGARGGMVLPDRWPAD